MDGDHETVRRELENAARARGDTLENVVDPDVLVVRAREYGAQKRQPHEQVADELVVPDEASAKRPASDLDETDRSNRREDQRDGDREDRTQRAFDAPDRKKMHARLVLRPIGADRGNELGAVMLVELIVERFGFGGERVAVDFGDLELLLQHRPEADVFFGSELSVKATDFLGNFPNGLLDV